LVLAFQTGGYIEKAAPSQVRPNPTNRVDVNGDGSISPIDALLVLNEWNRQDDGVCPMCWKDAVDATFHLDVNDDGYVSLADAQEVID
jgi:hypothetical protein